MGIQTKQREISDYVHELCSENIEYRNGRWMLRYADESLTSDEIATEIARDWGVSHNAARDLIRSWKAKEKARVEEIHQKQVEEVVKFPIPEKVSALMKRLEQVFCIDIEFHDSPIYLYNRGGYAYGMGKGFTLSNCTSSLECGPSFDYSKEIMEILKPFGFELSRSYGDNGMDSATNWHDTFWHYDIVYSPSIKYID